MAMLALLSALGPFAIDMYLPAFPQMMQDLNTSAATIQLTLTTFMLGMAVGQLVIGPLSDQFGRRKPLLIGACACLVASVLCAVAPNVEFLIGMRFVQGFAGAAGVVLARAIVSDSARGVHAAKMFSIMMAVGGIAPVLSPLAGGGVIGFAGWRGAFWALAVLNLLMVIGSIFIVKESLPLERRSKGGLKELFSNTGRVLGNKRYLGFAFAFAFSMAAMFGYISASPFVYQNILGLSATAFSMVFALNALGLTVTSIVGVKLVGALGPLRMTYIGVSALVVFSAVLLAVVVVGSTPLIPTLVVIFLAISSLGFVFGNAAALASDQVKEYAGSGSAIMGALQFALAAIASPLVGLAGEGSAMPMAVVMLVAGVIALLSLLAFTRGAAVLPDAERVERELDPVSPH
ncbi:DHA1 family bicyclomycin/chloramphenicol resistance-like MFS transporter [Arthrobacter ginsengisoli]|uniref:DHA1 family bicyclomycin/chloramphenicol resistance-like MFS transporter n=2 Tax=Arthrobacter ginsengisoli TaxID=1356565 RepID=A0ABU1UBG5_9MICC|nr:DHA1 family bicyclomycin/chloramphenicol resistance-like MFS transporter [Arthrobacter ginsengisoli]